MRVVLRADADPIQGTGHVMRCLTLAEELAFRGHEPIVAVKVAGVPWLSRAVAAAGHPTLDIAADELQLDLLLASAPDWVVLDSYRFDEVATRALEDRVPTLRIVDGQRPRGAARLYLDQTLGAVNAEGNDGGRVLAGAGYALVRRAVRDQRREEPWADATRVLAVIGGSDPDAAIVEVARQLASAGKGLRLTLVAPDDLRDAVVAAVRGHPSAEVVAPSASLPARLHEADIVVSAGGTSVAELATLGIPSIIIAVVANQRPGIHRWEADGLALVIDAAGGAGFDGLGAAVRRLHDERDLRRRLSETMRAHYDGRGAERVVAAMMQAVS